MEEGTQVQAILMQGAVPTQVTIVPVVPEHIKRQVR